ncbi:hypothetical protein GA0115240_117727 [Streptomyces sp. DvalAA-14]|uniref:hypothetical protein n=1 Tax=unclassified Streptomyces TaxID=2593676 RepID=UPI00081B3CCE|nr:MULTISPECIES: hypothetical protein [unclassified Streptomyces]MYS20230.1 hypothetical protein [Streptomyces sp. SID4948]SCD64000.1 hypothetical protein GA0115240_117727 [Streptomyces sp. DvalAA-14]
MAETGLRQAMAAAVLLLATGLTACAHPAQVAARPPVPYTVPTPTGATGAIGLHLPVERYMLTPTQSAQLSWVGNAMIRDCMRDHGFAFPAAQRPDAGSATYSVMYRRYGVSDPASVRTWGYHAPVYGAQHDTPKSKDPVLSSVGAAEVLFGADPKTGRRVSSYHGRAVPEQGCSGSVDRLLGEHSGSPQGPETGQDGVLARIKERSFADSMADPRTRKVFADWSACMASRGYRVADPMHAADALPPSTASAAPSRAEIAQAEADVACKSATNLVGVWFAVESDYQLAALHEVGPELAHITAERDSEARTLRRLYRTYAGVS